MDCRNESGNDRDVGPNPAHSPAMRGVISIRLGRSAKSRSISSRLVKEVWRLGGDIDGIVPAPVARHMRALRGARQE